MPAQARTCQHIPARPWNRLRRTTSHYMNDTYIAGYAPRFPFRTNVRPAWVWRRQGIEVKRLVHGHEAVPRRTGVSTKNILLTHKNVSPQGGWQGCERSPSESRKHTCATRWVQVPAPFSGHKRLLNFHHGLAVTGGRTRQASTPRPRTCPSSRRPTARSSPLRAGPRCHDTFTGAGGTVTVDVASQRTWGWDYLGSPLPPSTGRRLRASPRAAVVGGGGGFSSIEPMPSSTRMCGTRSSARSSTSHRPTTRT